MKWPLTLSISRRPLYHPAPIRFSQAGVDTFISNYLYIRNFTYIKYASNLHKQAFPIEYQHFLIWIIGLGNPHKRHTCRKSGASTHTSPHELLFMAEAYGRTLKQTWNIGEAIIHAEIWWKSGVKKGVMKVWTFFSKVLNTYISVKWTWNGTNVCLADLTSKSHHKMQTSAIQ